MNAEAYGGTIGGAMEKGLSIEEAVKIAYKEHGIIPLWKIYSYFVSPLFISTMGGVISGLYKQKIGLYNQKLVKALIKVTKEMS